MNSLNMNDKKPLLAIETSESLCSAAIYFSNQKFFTANFQLKYSHSEKLFEIIEFLFKSSDTEIKKLSGIAVSGGPGSFTGLRIGMAAAKGIAYGANVPIAVIPTFEALAYQLSLYLDDNSEFIIANKVNRDEVYYAKFQITQNSYIFVDDLTILSNSAFIDKSQDIKVFGNAAILIGNQRNEAVNIFESPSAEFVARWTIRFGKDKFTEDFNFVEPIYLKEFLVKGRKEK